MFMRKFVILFYVFRWPFKYAVLHCNVYITRIIYNIRINFHSIAISFVKKQAGIPTLNNIISRYT